MTSQDYLNQINTMGSQPTSQSFQQQVAQAYDAPVLRPLLNERADLESQYLPALFEPFTKMGTGAADMSAASKLALVGESMGRLGGRINANNSIQNYYGTQIGNVAQGLAQDWGNRNQNLWQQYNAKFGQEQADRAYGLQQQQLAESRASRAASAPPSAWNFPKPAGNSQANTGGADRERQANSLVGAIKRVAQVNYLKPDGSMGSRTSDPASQSMLDSYYKQLTSLGYDINKIKF